MKQERETWVDNVKVIACILVVLGHFFQSMTKSDIMPANKLYLWFDKTIYYFHVPLFFICSGYLYQRYSIVNGVQDWARNVFKKLIALGIPYLTFSSLTWLMKTLFASSVNTGVGGYWESLLFRPISPYWYLYCLFFLFVLTPTIRNIKMEYIFYVIAVALKIVSFYANMSQIFLISSVFSNEIWFVSGMCLAIGMKEYELKAFPKWFSVGIGIIFIILSIFLVNAASPWCGFGLGCLACAAIVEYCRSIDVMFPLLSQNTMPIFLMHTLFAAPVRIVLLKIGIHSCIIHVIVGLSISFIGPIICAKVMEKTKVLEFFLYPGKFIGTKNK